MKMPLFILLILLSSAVANPPEASETQKVSWREQYAMLRSDFISLLARVEKRATSSNPKWSDEDTKLLAKVVSDFKSLDKTLKARTPDETLSGGLEGLQLDILVHNAANAANLACFNLNALITGLESSEVTQLNFADFAEVFRRTDPKIDIGTRSAIEINPMASQK